jgi:hypothetical protein
MNGTMTGNELGARNRRVLRVLLGIVAALVIAAFLVGIRW